jgi:membrane protein implicated in regulation of membrane protease activity
MGRSRQILLLALGFVFLHLNYWMWDDARIVLGLPANLLYHVVLSLALSLVLFVLVRRAWPRYLDED